jgi:hypothetical protein
MTTAPLRRGAACGHPEDHFTDPVASLRPTNGPGSGTSHGLDATPFGSVSAVAVEFGSR